MAPMDQTVMPSGEVSYGTQVTVDPLLKGTSAYNLGSFEMPFYGYVSESATIDQPPSTWVAGARVSTRRDS